MVAKKKPKTMIRAWKQVEASTEAPTSPGDEKVLPATTPSATRIGASTEAILVDQTTQVARLGRQLEALHVLLGREAPLPELIIRTLWAGLKALLLERIDQE